MDLDFLANFAIENKEEEKSYLKKDVLKLLKQIGVDTRFVSYWEEDGIIELYIENLRFSKFSKKRVATFNNHYSDIKVIRSSLFQKICQRSSKVLANYLKPKSNILIPSIVNDYTKLLYIILEPYSRKYGLNFVYSNEEFELDKIDSIVSTLNLNQEVNNILTDIFNGDGINWDKKFELSDYYDDLKSNNSSFKENIKDKEIIFPLINVPEEWICDFIGLDINYEINYKDDNISSSFMGFLSEINPQFKENVLATSTFLESHQKNS